ncbi:MAG: FtsX-like permease family protein [Anaerosomatales bacterium]|nr:FtsX-like permease family protein [Anaerosomatales bacterium]
MATVSAIVSTGGDEDGWVIAPLTDVQSLSKSGNRISYLRVSALTDSEPAEKTAARLSGLIDGVRPEVVGSVASAEDNLLGKVQLLLALLTACVAGMSALGLFSMLGASVLERTGEIGLVKAIGASNGSVSRQIVAEAAVLAVAGAALGLLAGAGIVRLIGNSVFGVSMSLTIGAVPVAVASCLLLAISASLAAARRAARIDPAICLRGE